MAICSTVGRAEAEGGSRKEAGEYAGWRSSGVEYMCMDWAEAEDERAWRFGVIERLTETMRRDARGCSGMGWLNSTDAILISRVQIILGIFRFVGLRKNSLSIPVLNIQSI